jgi:DNA-binding IclR family transcriptional regulator
MIKVLNKTFAILEEIVVASPKPVSLGKLAATLDLNKATCSRIISDLVEAGYLVQKSRMEGYIAGPRAFTFGEQVSYKAEILREAQPVIKACAEKIGESVLMAEMHNLKRYILCHYNYNPTINVTIDQLAFDDLYRTATGTLLLAYASVEKVDAVIKRNGLPAGPFWDSVKSRDDLDTFLQDIRDRESFIYDGPRPNSLAIAAFPVLKNHNFIGVVGVSVPRGDFKSDHRDSVIKEVKSAAEKISLAISHIGSIG